MADLVIDLLSGKPILAKFPSSSEGYQAEDPISLFADAVDV